MFNSFYTILILIISLSIYVIISLSLYHNRIYIYTQYVNPSLLALCDGLGGPRRDANPLVGRGLTCALGLTLASALEAR